MPSVIPLDSPAIDERALVHPGARLAENVSVGPFSIIEDDVEIGENCRIGPHVIIRSHTRIGKNNRIFQFSSIGESPQHMAYQGESTILEIGDNNTIRENCTLSRGTPDGLGKTVIGDRNYLMAYVHVAHDCVLRNNIIFANGASLAGHVEVEEWAILGGFSLIHQYCRVGAHCITGIGSICLKDVPPFTVVAGNTATTYGINYKGLQRRDFSQKNINNLKKAYRCIYRSNLDLTTAIQELENSGLISDPYVKHFAGFHQMSQRGVIR